MDGFIEDMIVVEQLVVDWLAIMDRLIMNEFMGPKRLSTVTGPSGSNKVMAPARLSMTLVPVGSLAYPTPKCSY